MISCADIFLKVWWHETTLYWFFFIINNEVVRTLGTIKGKYFELCENSSRMALVHCTARDQLYFVHCSDLLRKGTGIL